LPLGDPEELPAGSLFGQDDEDFWQNPVAPVAATIRWPQQYVFGDQSDVPAGALKKFTSPDEDYWLNPIFALPAVGGVTPASFYQSLPYLFDEATQQVPSAAQDEDYWQSSVLPSQASFYQALPYSFDSGEMDFVNPLDEDFWANPVLPVQAANLGLYLPDAE